MQIQRSLFQEDVSPQAPVAPVKPQEQAPPSTVSHEGKQYQSRLRAASGERLDDEDKE